MDIAFTSVPQLLEETYGEQFFPLFEIEFMVNEEDYSFSEYKVNDNSIPIPHFYNKNLTRAYCGQEAHREHERFNMCLDEFMLKVNDMEFNFCNKCLGKTLKAHQLDDLFQFRPLVSAAARLEPYSRFDNNTDVSKVFDLMRVLANFQLPDSGVSFDEKLVEEFKSVVYSKIRNLQDVLPEISSDVINKVASLSSYVKAHSEFYVLKAANNSGWDEPADKTFEELTRYFAARKTVLSERDEVSFNEGVEFFETTYKSLVNDDVKTSSYVCSLPKDTSYNPKSLLQQILRPENNGKRLSDEYLEEIIAKYVIFAEGEPVALLCPKYVASLLENVYGAAVEFVDVKSTASKSDLLKEAVILAKSLPSFSAAYVVAATI